MSDEQPQRGPEWEENFRAHMRRQRERLGLSQTELAQRVRRHGPAFHQQTIARIEDGQRPVRLDEAMLIAEELDFRGSQFLRLLEPPDPTAAAMRQAVDEVRAASHGFQRAAGALMKERDRLARLFALFQDHDFGDVAKDALAETPEVTLRNFLAKREEVANQLRNEDGEEPEVFKAYLRQQALVLGLDTEWLPGVDALEMSHGEHSEAS